MEQVNFLALVSFLARSEPKVPFLGLSLLRNQTETLARLARLKTDKLHFGWIAPVQPPRLLRFLNA